MADLLRVEHLSKRFGGIVATDDLTFSIPKGELHAVIGPNGAGKTTLIAQLSGTDACPQRARVGTFIPEEIRSNAHICDAYLGEQEAVYG